MSKENIMNESDIDRFLEGHTFVVLARNKEDPSPDGPFEPWAYQGPLDFDAAAPVKFGLGMNSLEALQALNAHLPAGGQATLAPRVGPDTALRVSRRELATILAALRFHQAENLQAGTGIPDDAIRDIATDGGTVRALTLQEVERLCERINLPATPEDRPQDEVHRAIQQIHDLLYLDMEDGREFYNPDKGWDANTITMIADVVAEHIPRPETTLAEPEP